MVQVDVDEVNSLNQRWETALVFYVFGAPTLNLSLDFLQQLGVMWQSLPFISMRRGNLSHNSKLRVIVNRISWVALISWVRKLPSSEMES